VPDVLLVKLEPDVGRYQVAPPFGILYLASALRQAGFSVRLIHERGSTAAISNVVERVVRERPLMVGLSTLTGPSLAPTLQVSRQIRNACDIPIVWGGFHPTMLPEQTLASGCVDVAVIGEGEETVVDLAASLAQGGLREQALGGIPGIAFRAGGQTVLTGRRRLLPDLDRYRPEWELLDIRSYFFGDRHFYSDLGSKLTAPVVASVITSRGCPWRCGYCYNQFVNARSFRAHSAERVIADIEALKARYGVSALIFEDDCFFADRERGLAIVRRLGIPWGTSIRASEIVRWGSAFVGELAGLQCQEVRIGAESGSQRMLDLVEKDITVEQIEKAVELCASHGIRTTLSFMIGFPDETREDIDATFALMDRLEAKGAAVAVNGPGIYLPWPGTALYELAVRRGFRPPATTDGWARALWGARQPRTPFLPTGYQLSGYYRFLAFRKEMGFLRLPFFARVLAGIARLRWQRRFFRFPLDYHLPRLLLRALHRVGLRKLGEAVYN